MTVARGTKPTTPRKPTKPAVGRRIAPGWTTVESFVVDADGRAYAGECGHHRVCAFDHAGNVAWQRTLRPASGNALYSDVVHLARASDALLALPRGKTICVIDPATGDVRRELTVPEAWGFAITPDGSTLVLQTGSETTLVAYPGGNVIATFPEYIGGRPIAISPDSRWLVVTGQEIHVYDLRARRHATSFKTPMWPKILELAVAFTPDGRIVTGSTDRYLRIHERETWRQIAEIDLVPGATRKPVVISIACNERHIAVGCQDGKVLVLDAKTFEPMWTSGKHDTARPGTGHKSLSQVALGPGGALWVSAAPSNKPPGLSIYDGFF